MKRSVNICIACVLGMILVIALSGCQNFAMTCKGEYKTDTVLEKEAEKAK